MLILSGESDYGVSFVQKLLWKTRPTRECTASVFYESSEENSHCQHSKASLVQVMSEKISELQGMARARRALAGVPALENWRGM